MATTVEAKDDARLVAYDKHETVVDSLPTNERTVWHPSVAWLIRDWRKGGVTHDEIVIDLQDFFGIKTSEKTVRNVLKRTS